jgi:sugar phosphate isomerase/epimerase
MDIVLNSKFFSELSPAELGEKIKAFGYDGVDPCIRPGHPVTFDNVDKALPAATRVWKDQGVVCPMVSAPIDFNDATLPEAERLYAACGASGIPLMKMGYFRYHEGDDYWSRIDDVRKALDSFQHLGEKHGVKTLCHTHSGPFFGSNCSGLMHLLKGFDPRYTGAYVDFGHLALDGEDMAMGLGIVRDYLSAIGIKDAFHAHQPDQTPSYIPQFTATGEGSVNWRRALTLLVSLDFVGPLCVHTEYEFDESIIRNIGYADTKPERLEEVAQEDLRYLRKLLAETGGRST